jgi:DNA-binding Lrp family transcriptional regulator
MAIRGYVLIQAEVGKAKFVADAIGGISRSDGRAVPVDTVTGPFDVIVQTESDGLDELGIYITDGIQKVAGVQRTTTCLSIRLG